MLENICCKKRNYCKNKQVPDKIIIMVSKIYSPLNFTWSTLITTAYTDRNWKNL